jgi:hypothetical protein
MCRRSSASGLIFATHHERLCIQLVFQEIDFSLARIGPLLNDPAGDVTQRLHSGDVQSLAARRCLSRCRPISALA